MNGWTKGPWTSTSDPRPQMGWNKWVKAGRQNICVLSQNHKGDFATSEANAALIAAAPDLFEALRAARQWVEANTAQVRGLSAAAAEPGEAMLRQIDAVMSKARGETT